MDVGFDLFRWKFSTTCVVHVTAPFVFLLDLSIAPYQSNIADRCDSSKSFLQIFGVSPLHFASPVRYLRGNPSEGGHIMTNVEARKISELQRRGMGYRRIASVLNLPINTVKSYCQRHPVEEAKPQVSGCKNCGADLGENAAIYKKQFCCDGCRTAWWNAHRRMLRHTPAYTRTCAYCGEPFSIYGRPNQRYCSRDCYQRQRKKAVTE